MFSVLCVWRVRWLQRGLKLCWYLGHCHLLHGPHVCCFFTPVALDGVALDARPVHRHDGVSGALVRIKPGGGHEDYSSSHKHDSISESTDYIHKVVTQQYSCLRAVASLLKTLNRCGATTRLLQHTSRTSSLCLGKPWSPWSVRTERKSASSADLEQRNRKWRHIGSNS